MRRTKAALYPKVARLQSWGYDVALHFAYDKPRLESVDQSANISPRLSVAEMHEWLDGFTAGLAACYNRFVFLPKNGTKPVNQ